MANAANNAALKAAMEEGGYRGVKNMVNNYIVPKNHKKHYDNMRNRMRYSNASYLTKNETNRNKANIQFDKEVIKNLIRMGIKSARRTPKQIRNADVNIFKTKRAAKVIHRALLKKVPVTAAKVKARKMKETANAAQKKANNERRIKESAAAARERTAAAAASRREMVTLGSNAIGPRGKLTAAGRAVAPSNKPKPNTTTTNRARAPQPSVPQRANRGAPGVFAGLSPDAVAVARNTVMREVTAPRARASAPSTSRSRLEKAMKKGGR